MTLIVALKGKDGIVVASDSRGTFGDPRGVTAQNDTIKKVHLVKNVAVLMAGSEQANIIIEEAAREVEQVNSSGVTDIMTKIREVGRRKFSEWYQGFPFFPLPQQNPGFVRPSIQLVIAGYDVDRSGTQGAVPRMYSMTSNYDFAPNLHDFGFAIGGVGQYALYLLNRLYSPDMTTTSLKHLATYVVTETAAQDGKVGGPVQLGVVTPTTATMLAKDDIDKIIVENENKSKELKNLFRNIR